MRNRQTGEPNGMFLDNAQELITKRIPARPLAENARDLERGAKRNQALGWTGLHVPSSSLRELTAIEQLYQEHRIKLRIDLALLGPSDDAGWLLKHGPIVGAFDGRLTCRAIKVSFDGALGSKAPQCSKSTPITIPADFSNGKRTSCCRHLKKRFAKEYKSGRTRLATVPTTRFFAFTKKR